MLKCKISIIFWILMTTIKQKIAECIKRCMACWSGLHFLTIVAQTILKKERKKKKHCCFCLQHHHRLLPNAAFLFLHISDKFYMHVCQQHHNMKSTWKSKIGTTKTIQNLNSTFYWYSKELQLILTMYCTKLIYLPTWSQIIPGWECLNKRIPQSLILESSSRTGMGSFTISIAFSNMSFRTFCACQETYTT